MQCHLCEQDKEGLPFRCNYCGETFCADHRLPENHSCPKVGGPLRPGHITPAKAAQNSNWSGEKRFLPTVRSGRSRFRLQYAGLFSRIEKKHVLIATLVMVLIGLSLNWYLFFPNHYELLLLLVPGFAISFVGHELAHKILAQRNGLWAEFRTNTYGFMLAAISIAFPIKFLAPGQTNIQGEGRKEILGAVAVIGPGFNLVLGSVFLIISRFTYFLLGAASLELAVFNSWMAIFNLLPFGTFDGTTVFEWDRTRWIIAFASAIALMILSSYTNLIWR